MRKVLDILRRASAEATPYHQRLVFETEDETATVATALTELNARPALVDEQGVPAEPIMWERSCLQKKCGACAMLIDGVPRVACDTRLSSLRAELVTLAPLRKFPVVADLVVDRHAVFDRLEQTGVWLERKVGVPTRRSKVAYEASRCLQCGCCLEVCPNFFTEGAFGGMATMVPLARLLSEVQGEERSRLARAYREAVFGGCGKSLACRSICPAGIDIASLMSRSNAAAIWRRW